MDRANSDPRYRRRQLILLVAVYVVSMVVGVSEAIRGYQPALSLVGLPIPLLLVYWLLRTARRNRGSTSRILTVGGLRLLLSVERRPRTVVRIRIRSCITARCRISDDE